MIHSSSALVAWEAENHAHNYQWSGYWLQAVSDPASAFNSGSPDTTGCATAIAELRLASVGEGAAAFAENATDLNEFFGTSGAYGSAY